MMSDHAWMELCEVSESTFEALQSSDTVCVQLGKSTKHPELTTLILQAVPSPHFFNGRTVYLHPLLYEFLTKSSLLEDSGEHDDATDFPVSIAPLPLHEYCNMETSLKQSGWTISRVRETVDLPNSSRISMTCVYYEPSGVTKQFSSERQMSIALQGRLIQTNTMLALPTLSGVCLVTVSNIEGEEIVPSTVYRVGSDVVLDVTFIDTLPVPENPTAWDREIPGYDELLQQLITLSQLTGVAAPSGVLLTGCAGVGKSRLASCLAHVSQSNDNMHIHWVSSHDLLVRASWATESDLLELLLPAAMEETRCLLVLDDLHILENEDSEDPFRDPELLTVNNSILVALDRVSCGASSFVLGICHVASQLPKEFVRIGRLEKEIHMPPPTQVQREEILASILHDATNENTRHRWAECLASQTAGCVALDLRRLCADAGTKAWSRSQQDIEITWNDLREAAQICVPSQLAQLDVTKTSPYPEEDGAAPDMLKVHEWSWRDFGGYSAVKKRLFRTVVMPWRRFISVSGRGNDKNLDIQESWITPPSGVLFHGPSGVGKSFAASCLASSLGLHVVKVRASDVLDQWLGGSEATIRSLFARARSASPCILFFDEIDAIANNRENGGASVDVTSRVLTTFLNEMDGISSGENTVGGVLVIACTNRFEALDAALLRPGRLDEHVLLEMPVLSDVEEILQLCLSKVPLHENVSTSELSELFVELNASGADVVGVCRDACTRAIRDKTRSSLDLMVSQDDLIAAIRDWRK